jgi:chromosome segregation ATPase
MIRRDRKAPRATARGGQRASPAAREADEIARLERERDGLKEALAAAETRIGELERQRKEILDRIDWVLDSLHSLLERDG